MCVCVCHGVSVMESEQNVFVLCHSHDEGWTRCVCERVCVTVCVSWCHSHYGVYICIMCIFVYHGVMAIVEAGQNVCVSLCICIMYMFVYHGVIAIM